MASLRDALYEADSGLKHYIRVGLATLNANTTPPEGNPTSPIPARSGKGGREFGLGARRVGLVRTVSAAGRTFRIRAQVAILSKTVFDNLQIGANFDYDGNSWVITNKFPEDYR